LQQHRRWGASLAGAVAKADVGMSNDNAGEKPARRKTKVSLFNGNQNRVSRDLRTSREAAFRWQAGQHSGTCPGCDGATKERKGCGLTE